MVPRFQNRSEPKPVSVLSPIGENHTQNHTGLAVGLLENKQITTSTGAGRTPVELSEIEQTAPLEATLTPEMVDALSDALADALVADYLAELGATVGSPRGSDHV